MDASISWWFPGFEEGLAALPETSGFFQACAKNCLERRGLLDQFRSLKDASGGSLDGFFQLMNQGGDVETEVLTPGREYRMMFTRCTCPLHCQGYVDTPLLCGCSRQSILYTIRALWPEKNVSVKLEETILRGGTACRFRIRVKEGRSLFMDLKFDEKGLIPAIVQDHYTKEVLTLAYMNAESLAITIDERRTCFWSRSRQALWRKGETSGNVQHVVSITADCDRDALVVEVVKDGPACHTGAESCFFHQLYLSDELKQFSYEGLYQLIAGRKAEPKEGSYTTYLFQKGLDKILKKVGEECTEVIIGGRKEDKAETVYEIADLCYHVMVLMVQMGITVEDVTRELEKRHVVDHKVKQERMQ